MQERHPGPQRDGRVRPAEDAQPVLPQPLAHGRGHQRRVGVPMVAEASSIAPSRVTRRATTRPSRQATSSLSCQSADPASRARSSVSGAAERTVASRPPGRRSASAIASQGRPASPEPGGSGGAGAGGHQVRRGSGTQAGDPVGVGQGHDQADRDVVGEPGRRHRGLRRAASPRSWATAARHAPAAGPPRRRSRSAATRSPPGARTSSESSATISAARRRAHQVGAVDQGAGQPRVGRDGGDRAAAVGHLPVVVAARPGTAGRRARRPAPPSVAGRAAPARPGRACPRPRSRARTTPGRRWRSPAPGGRRGGRGRARTSSGTPPRGPPGPRARPVARRPPG